MEHSKKILIAEDQEDIAFVISTGLSQAGYEITVCKDGQKAYEVALTDPNGWYALVTDYYMPKLDGIGLVLALKSACIRFEVVVMVSSMVKESPLVCKFVQSEKIFGIPKPFKLADLLEIIASARAA